MFAQDLTTCGLRLLLALGIVITPLMALPGQAAHAAGEAGTCNAFANQKTWHIELDATYSRKDSDGPRETEVSQMANFDVIFEEEYTDASKVEWRPQLAKGIGRVQGRDVTHVYYEGGQERTEDDFGSGAPVAVHGMLRLNRVTCTYDLWADVSINATTVYDGEDASEHVDSPVDFKVVNRPVPTDTARMAAPALSATEPFTVYVVTTGQPEEFIPSYAAAGVRAVAIAHGLDTAGHAMVTWRIVPGQPLCQGRPGPIDVHDPVLEDEAGLVNVDLVYDEPYVLPNGKAKVRAVVTCAGTPISNARVIVVGDVFDQSGAHVHGKPGRPEGYFNGVKIVDGKHFIELKTDSRGIAEFDFEPGRDTLNERIGISGEYHLSANLPEFYLTTDSLTLIAKVPNLQALEQSSRGHINWDANPAHNWQGHWGTPATLAAIHEIAEMYIDTQQENNSFRIARGALPWPYVPLFVNDISLPWGGLFDVVGWDSVAGRVRGAEWQPPHYTHTDGKEVDFSVSPIIGPLQTDWKQVRNTPLSPAEIQEATTMLRAALRSFARLYGTWISNQTYTLRVGQGGQQTDLVTNLATDLASVRSTTAGADAEVAIFPADVRRDGNPVIAAGQPISLSLVAHNLLGTAPANGSTLFATLPAGLNFVSANPAPSRFEGGQPVWDVGTLLTGTRMSLVNLTATVAANIAAGTPLTVSARVSTTSADTNPANNESATTLVVQPLGPDQGIINTLETMPLLINQPTTFSVTVTNHGTLSAALSELSVVLPPSVTLKSAVPPATSVNDIRDFRWHFGTVALNESRTVTLTVELKPDAVDVSHPESLPALPFRFVVGSDKPDVFTDNNDVVITRTPAYAGADLGLELLTQGLISPGMARPGDVITVVVPYANHSQQIAPSALISVLLGSGLTVLEAQPAAGIVPVVTADGVHWSLGDLASGASGLLVLRCKVGTLEPLGSSITALAQSAAYDMDFDNNLKTRTVWPAKASASLTPVLFLPMMQR